MHVDVNDLFRLLVVASAAELDGQVRLVAVGTVGSCRMDVSPGRLVSCGMHSTGGHGYGARWVGS